MTTTESRPATVGLRDEVQAWLDEHWDPALTVDEWWRLVAEAGWTVPHLDAGAGGRGLPRRAQGTVRRTFAEHGANIVVSRRCYRP